MRIWKTAAFSIWCVLAVATINATASDKTYNLTTIDFPNAIATNIADGIGRTEFHQYHQYLTLRFGAN